MSSSCSRFCSAAEVEALGIRREREVTPKGLLRRASLMVVDWLVLLGRRGGGEADVDVVVGDLEKLGTGSERTIVASMGESAT